MQISRMLRYLTLLLTWGLVISVPPKNPNEFENPSRGIQETKGRHVSYILHEMIFHETSLFVLNVRIELPFVTSHSSLW